MRPPDDTLMEIEGYCPFLMCTKPSPHTHHVCGECGAVRFGNASCEHCTRMAAVLGDER